MNTNTIICSLRKRIVNGEFTLYEATQSDKRSLEACLRDLEYLSDFTGWNDVIVDEAQTLLDHKDLPKNGIKENDRVYIIQRNNITIGYTKFYEGAFSPDKIFLGFFGITKEYQREGNGAKAYAILEEEIKNCGYKSIRLNVGTKNIPAMIFWIKNGYTKIVRYYLYENGFLDINLEKEIT